MAERLGRGLQIRLQRFNSASHLQRPRASGVFLWAAGAKQLHHKKSPGLLPGDFSKTADII